MVRGAIFDVDGTLLDSMHVWDTVASDYVKANNMVPADDLDSRTRECCLRDVSIIMRDEYGMTKPLEQLDRELSEMVKFKYYNLVQLTTVNVQTRELLGQRTARIVLWTFQG